MGQIVIAVDTNIITGLLRGDIKTLPQSDLYVPYVVIAELKAGAQNGNNPKKYLRIIEEFLAGANVTSSPGLATDVITNYTEIYSYLRKNGTPVSPNDLWIAAECMNLSLSLHTLDQDFKHIPHVILV